MKQYVKIIYTVFGCHGWQRDFVNSFLVLFLSGKFSRPSPTKNLIFESFKVSSYSHIIVTSTSKVVFALSHNKLRNPLLSSKPAWSFFNIFNYDVACGLSSLEKLPSPPQWERDGIFSISVTEIARLAIDRNGFRCALKDVGCPMARDKQLK